MSVYLSVCLSLCLSCCLSACLTNIGGPTTRQIGPRLRVDIRFGKASVSSLVSLGFGQELAPLPPVLTRKRTWAGDRQQRLRSESDKQAISHCQSKMHNLTAVGVGW